MMRPRCWPLAILLLCAALLVLGCGGPRGADDEGPLLESRASGSPGEVGASLATGVALSRPRFDPSGQWLVAMAGEPGARRLVLRAVDGETWTLLTAGDGELASDDRDPDWLPDGRGVVFASNRAGADTGYDLYRLALDAELRPVGAPQPLGALPGDEVEPTVSALEWSFMAVHTDGCSDEGAGGQAIDGYRKIAFTRHIDDASEVWFTSDNGRHRERLSPADALCRAPSWSGSGLSLTWVCSGTGGVVYESEAHWQQSFMGALRALEGTAEGETFDGEALSHCNGDDVLWRGDDAPPWYENDCLVGLPRQYSTFAPHVASRGTSLEAPSFSANQTVLVAHGPDGGLRYRQRDPLVPDATWPTLPGVDDPAARDLDWSPQGTRVAFAAAGDIVVLDTDFYLQDVVNLADFPELYGDTGESPRLAEHHFVAREGREKEFHVLYDKLRYARRPQFITADAALQVFRDEFVRVIQAAEADAAVALAAVSRALFEHYAARHARTGHEVDRYLAVHFGVPWVWLEANARVELPDAEAYMDRQMFESYADPEAGDTLDEDIERQFEPVAPRFAQHVDAVLAELPEPLRAPIAEHVQRGMAHEGIAELTAPGYDDPVKVDFSLYVPRGPYADGALMGYFMAMSWYGTVPLALDASLAELLDTLGPLAGDAPGALAAQWSQVDRLVGAFMGRPVDASLRHVAALRAEQPEIFEAKGFDRDAVREGLIDKRGPVPIRNASSAAGGERPLVVTFFPKRAGFDVVAHSALTHPAVHGRAFPGALDVMAALGVPRAGELGAAALAGDEAMADAWHAQMATLTAGGEPTRHAYWSTDLYHAWLATLRTLAMPLELDPALGLDFAHTTAWQERQLASALAGYAQLKHAAVLYSEQAMGVECDSGFPIYVLVEQPVLERPRGFVEPMPALFEQLAALGQQVYEELGQGTPPDGWTQYDEAKNAAAFATRLAAIARAEVAGQPLSDEDLAFIEVVGGVLEELYIGGYKDAQSIAVGGEGRLERGVALVTDIYTNLERQQVVELGVGRLDALYVLVPNRQVEGARPWPGRRVTQGGMLSFYEFLQPMGDRLTDEAWHERLTTGDAPPRPDWVRSFLEPVP